MSHDQKIVVVMPAYNAAKTLRITYADLPPALVDQVILVDDGSSDDTVKIARELGLELFVHNRNYGYGANQKTCYREALKAGAEIIVMVHPDYQYDPKLLPRVIEPIERDEADVVLGSRLMEGNPMRQGMPWWKYVSNRFLTFLENRVFGLRLSVCVYRISEAAHSVRDLPELYRSIHASIGEVLPARNLYIALLDREMRAP